MNIIIFGPPGSGKGTQSTFIASALNLDLLRTGHLFREIMQKETALGKEVQEIVRSGQLITDEITISVVRDYLTNKDNKKGMIFDGFPRTVIQAEALGNLSLEFDFILNCVIELQLEEKIIYQRLCQRVTCASCGAVYNASIAAGGNNICGACNTPSLVVREDDKEEVVKKRIEVYHNFTFPLVNYYKEKGIFYSLNASMPIDVVKDHIVSITKNINN